MAEYTPTTDEVLEAWKHSDPYEEPPFRRTISAFDRWLDVVIREAKAKALEEAADAMGVDLSFRDPLRLRAGWLRARAADIRGGAE